ncbi:MAG: septal ring lytic transglycosylase RlpA family protein [Sphingobacteriales bacterium]|jgi:rare lipoprotein A|nr:septal ring lytic transglycosylase RlpA family protein [Sphingobacteriales bacterium]
MKKIVISLLIVIPFCIANAQVEFGTASYYGVNFHGKPTASGEIYSQNKLTAAHKSLPLGTILKVTNAQNNKSVYVKVNDRGPFIKGRIVDVSTKAAELLGFRNKGTAYVKLEVVEPGSISTDLLESTADIAQQNGIQEYDSSSNNNVSVLKQEDTSASASKTATAPATTSYQANNKGKNPPLKSTDLIEDNAITNRSPYFVITNIDKTKTGFFGLQLGVFSDMNAVLALIEELEAKYKQTMAVQQVKLQDKTVYKLLVGKFQNRAYADALKSTLSDRFKDAFVVKYE